jgi:hypothetical protein
MSGMPLMLCVTLRCTVVSESDLLVFLRSRRGEEHRVRGNKDLWELIERVAFSTAREAGNELAKTLGRARHNQDKDIAVEYTGRRMLLPDHVIVTPAYRPPADPQLFCEMEGPTSKGRSKLL